MATVSKESGRFLAYLALSNWQAMTAVGIGVGLGHPSTRATTWKGVKWGGRNVARPILGGYATAAKNVLRGTARAATPMLAGYVIGATVGTAVAHVAFDDEGADRAFDLYSNPKAFVHAGLLGAPGNAQEILEYYI